MDSFGQRKEYTIEMWIGVSHSVKFDTIRGSTSSFRTTDTGSIDSWT